MSQRFFRSESVIDNFECFRIVRTYCEPNLSWSKRIVGSVNVLAVSHSCSLRVLHRLVRNVDAVEKFQTDAVDVGRS